MKAMIFAAGLGTRLRPLTNDRPKALVEIKGKTLLELCIRRLIRFGFDEIIINVHHFGDKVIKFLEKNKNFGIRIEVSDERNKLLDTGGGLKKAAWFFDDGEPFLLCNVDVLTNLDLSIFYQTHLESDALASLAVRSRETTRYLLFDAKQILRGWKNINTGATRMVRRKTNNLRYWAFSGIHIIDPKIFEVCELDGVFSIIDVYLTIGGKHQIKAFPHNDDLWLDVGKPESLEQGSQILNQLLDD